ncbi:MAG TPA: CopG family transcriptional regulator [Beijerinckiaceae bacterium]|jgi:predicted transcriptional regulator
MGVLRIDLGETTEVGLARLAERTGASVERLAVEALERFVADETVTVEGIERALEDARHGRVVPHEEVASEVERLIAEDTGGSIA